MIALRDYAKIKNNYCICYFGYSDEYLVQLSLLKPHLERAFVGLNIFLGCKDDKTDYLKGHNILKISDLKSRKHEFAHIREIRYDGIIHPIEFLIKESGIHPPTINTSAEQKTTKGVIFTKGMYPTRDLNEREIKISKKVIAERGCDLEFNTNIENAGIVIGVECPQLFEAAAQGIKTILVPTGVGTWLYKTFFPNGKLQDIYS